MLARRSLVHQHLHQQGHTGSAAHLATGGIGIFGIEHTGSLAQILFYIGIDLFLAGAGNGEVVDVLGLRTDGHAAESADELEVEVGTQELGLTEDGLHRGVVAGIVAGELHTVDM